MTRTSASADLLVGAIDCHVHVTPHINGRSIDAFEAVRQAASAGMRGLGLMDNFCNSSGYAALCMRELGHLGVDVFGGLIMQPSAGGVDLECARSAVLYGYGPGTGARFLSLPTHHTRHVAKAEGRSPAYIESCTYIPETGPIPDPIPAIMDLCAEHDVVFDCGHVSGPEALRLVVEARKRGVARVRTHCSRAAPEIVAAIGEAGGYTEFSYFLVSLAAQVGLTHVDKEKHSVGAQSLDDLLLRIRAAKPEAAVLSTDSGISILPVPVEALRSFLLTLEAAGIPREALRGMTSDNPARLFKITAS
jgi:hypothetical protein